ncbi:hypothetical protein [Paenibacillus sp. CF384]|uniref:hypothetical protein n=1 Tax=Paenibacillus sp. CF384 TaxID=1884382 RepID=UPI00089B8345|nr:hypothetical protein [Paenibacillus sp. CF384]SDX71466.1 hypothetical protein SAMN05518855_101983 [Paenibacillus sp. CF384]
MTAIMLILLIFLVCLSLIMLASIWYMRFMMAKIFGEKHHDLEVISSSGMIPETWSRKFTVKMIQLHETGNEEGVRSLQQAAARSYLKRLRRLTVYVQKTNLVDNEETRKQMLLKLQNVIREWSDEAQHGSFTARA